MSVLMNAGEALYAAGYEARRQAYAAGLFRPRSVPARVVSVGNLSVGGTGKTTLTLHLARCARAHGLEVAVACRRYHPGPEGRGDEELLYEADLGASSVFAGDSKREQASRAAAAGARLILVDDGFSHWGLERDLDLVVLDASDPWGGGRLLPAGRLREPIRSLQRAEVVVWSRVGPDADLAALKAAAHAVAPAALLAAGRHRIERVRDLAGATRAAEGPARVVTATGNPAAVERSAREAGFAPVVLSAYRDHHWFTGAEALRERAEAKAAGATLVLTAKDAVRWPGAGSDEGVAVLEVVWEWLVGGEAVERRVLGSEAAPALGMGANTGSRGTQA